MTSALEIFTGVQLGFILLTIFSIFALHRTFRRISLKPWPLTLGIISWTAITGLFSSAEFFQDYLFFPPRIPVFVFLAMMGTLYIIFLSPYSKALRSIPQSRLLLLQGFCIPFDILTGITGPLLSIYVKKHGDQKSKNLVLIWNILGLGLLANVVFHRIFSQPYPITWLSIFLVPMALFLHILSIRKAFSKEIHLENPGAGISTIIRLIATYLHFPKIEKTLVFSKAVERFEKENEKILKVVSSLNSNELSEKRLVPQIPGLEDSSRYWSVAMTLEHLTITMPGFFEIIKSLNAGRDLDLGIKVENVKPQKKMSTDEIIVLFKAQTSSITKELKTMQYNSASKAKAQHPWFGALGLNSWLWLLGAHQGIHRRQIELISFLHKNLK